MKRRPVTSAWAAALIAGAVVATPSAFAAGKCDNPNGMIEQTACAKAAQGPDALRRFVERTRNVYALYYRDFAPSDTGVASAGTVPAAARVPAVVVAAAD